MFINVLFRHKSKTKMKHSDKCFIESGKAYLKALLYTLFLKDSFLTQYLNLLNFYTIPVSKLS